MLLLVDVGDGGGGGDDGNWEEKEEVSEKEDGTCKNGDNAKLTAMIAEDDAMFQSRRPCAMLAGTWRRRATTPNHDKNKATKMGAKGERGWKFTEWRR